MLARAALETEARRLAAGSRIVDLGCGAGETLGLMANLIPGAQLHGCDRQTPRPTPSAFQFTTVDLDGDKLPYADDTFDLAIAQHVIEHLRRPIEFITDALRILAPGGRLFLECPSNHSLLFSYPFAQKKYYILHFHDDPTHIGHPWTPQSLHRLALYHSCRPIVSKYEFSLWSVFRVIPSFIYAEWTGDSDVFVRDYWRATGWAMFAVIEKPATMTGVPPFHYFSMRGHRAGSVGSDAAAASP